MCTKLEYFLILVVCLVYVRASKPEKIFCKDGDGKNTAWFFNYTLPKTQNARNIKYAFLIEPGASTWTLASEDPLYGSMMKRTLDLFYGNEKNLTYLFYNDPQARNSKSASGYLKGMLVFDGMTGFWLSYSIPNVPVPTENEYSESAEENGEIVLCISFETAELNEIVSQLVLDNPKIYAAGLTEEVEKQLNEETRMLFSANQDSVEQDLYAEVQPVDDDKFSNNAMDYKGRIPRKEDAVALYALSRSL